MQNRLSLFSVANEKYAMSNAVLELKKIATDVIDSNDNDGVAKWIEKNEHRINQIADQKLS
ncbi:MAG: HAD hydrolase family protein [Oscillospiraceae bacterium]|nr:HAD hydrolase family protein [Oscillospiraceae bacterium]